MKGLEKKKTITTDQPLWMFPSLGIITKTS